MPANPTAMTTTMTTTVTHSLPPAGLPIAIVGAGLAVCRTIAERHGAHITATAAVGQGCTVRVEWPAAAA